MKGSEASQIILLSGVKTCKLNCFTYTKNEIRKILTPEGEFLGGVYATPVYKLLGFSGLPATQMPKLNEPISGQIQYHIRPGNHDVLTYDWEQYLNFMDKHFR